MSVDRRIRVHGNQELDEVAERLTLLRCAGVLWCSAVSSAAADIADTYTVRVVSYGVRADLLYRSATVYTAVAVDYKVVAYTLPAPLFVPEINICHGVVSALWGGATVYYYLINLTHTKSHFAVFVQDNFCAHRALNIALF